MKANKPPASVDSASLNVDAGPGESVLASYRNAFAEFTDEEMAILDGIIFEPET